MRAQRRADGTFVLHLDRVEREVMEQVVTGVADLLEPEEGAVADRVVDAQDPAAALLASLAAPDEPVAAPEDPAVHRLLPDGSRDDPQVAAEFRRLTEADLRTRKLARLRALADALAGDDERVHPEAEITTEAQDGPVEPGVSLVVPPALAPEMAATLTDVRLVLADRLGLRTDDDTLALEEGRWQPPTGPDGSVDEVVAQTWPYLVASYELFHVVQAALVRAMTDDLRRGRP